MPKYDIHYQPVPERDVRGYKTFTFGYKAAVKVDGIQGLVNRWAKTFMTPKGSDPLDAEAGTNFARLIGMNISKVSGDLEDVATLAIEDANAQVRTQDIEGLYPENESLLSAHLLDFVASGSGIEMWIEIKNLAGTVLPIRVVNL